MYTRNEDNHPRVTLTRPGIQIAAMTIVVAALDVIRPVFDRYGRSKSVRVARICRELRYDNHAIESALRVLASVGFVVASDGATRLTPAGMDAMADFGYVRWALGYRRLLGDAASLCQMPKRPLDLLDLPAIAKGSAEIGMQDIDHFVDNLVESVPFCLFIDLGCGSANYLVSLVGRRPDRRGIGVDVDADVCKKAQQTVKEAGLSDRITIIQGDARFAADQISEQADLVVARFVLHDLINFDESALMNITRLLKSCGRIVLAEVEPAHSLSMSPFQAGFTWIHALMGQRLLAKDEWRQKLNACGLCVLDVMDATMPGAFIMHAKLEGGRHE